MRELIFTMQEKYSEFLSDESGFSGSAESISFPRTEEEIRKIMNELPYDMPVTVQGAKTGITGAAVPEGGHILNLSRMNAVKGMETENNGGVVFLRAEPGITLANLKKEIARLDTGKPVFWPPDPTEDSASLGGCAALNAGGLCSPLYGETRNYIEAVQLMDRRGHTRKIRREDRAVLSSGRTVQELDAVLGREGITGILTEICLRLIPKPESMWGISFFFRDESAAAGFLDQLKEQGIQNRSAGIAAAEYLDRAVLSFIEEERENLSEIQGIPSVPEGTGGMVYLELHGDEESVEKTAEGLLAAAEESGIDPEKTWAVSGEGEIEKMHAFRHAAAEMANRRIRSVQRKDPRITKLATDMRPAGMPLQKLFEKYRADAAEYSLDLCIFGHAAENHLHVNLLPEDYESYLRGISLLRKWAAETAESGGSIIGEHGIGKLKKMTLGPAIPEEYISFCQDLKKIYDRDCLINRGNIL